MPHASFGTPSVVEHLDEDIGFLVLRSIRRIVRQVSRHSRSMARDTGLTVPQLLCLRAIEDRQSDGGDVTLAMVAEDVSLSNSTVSGVVSRLVDSGFVHRGRSSVDRRRLCLSLTDEGRTRLREIPGPLQETFLKRLKLLSYEEQQNILAGLNRVVRLMDAESLQASPVLVPGEDAPR